MRRVFLGSMQTAYFMFAATNFHFKVKKWVGLLIFTVSSILGVILEDFSSQNKA